MLKKKTKSFFISVATVLCLSLSTASLLYDKNDKVKASANGASGDNTLFIQDVTADYNVTPAEYLGIKKDIGTKVRFSAGETVTFSKEITVNAEMTDLIDFAPHPMSAVVNGEKLYKYDLEEVKIRVDKLDDSGNVVADSYIEVVVFTDTENRSGVGTGGNGASDDWTGNGLCGIYAYGPNQQPVGYRNVNGADRMSKLGTAIHFSFYKGGANGRASNDRLLLQYNAQTNSLHFANAVAYTGSSANPNPNPEKIIRDFDASYEADANNKWTTTETNVFAGFAENDKLRISVTTVGNQESKDLFFYQIGGEASIVPVHTPIDTALMLNSQNALIIPKAKLYTANGLEVSTETLLGKTGAEVKVEAIGQGEAGADLLVRDFTAYDEAGAVITLENNGSPIVGNCRFTYRIPNSNGFDQYSAVFEVMTEETANIEYPLYMSNVKANWTSDNRYPANLEEFAIPVSATMVSEMDRNGFDTVEKMFSVYKDVNANGIYDEDDSIVQGYLAGTDTKIPLENCDLSQNESSFNVEEEGTYFVVYKAVDGLGRTLTSLELEQAQRPQPIIISFSGHRFAEGLTQDEIKDGEVRTVSYQKLSVKKANERVLSKSDIVFYDYRVNSISPEFAVEIQITNPNGMKQPYDSNYTFPFAGEYIVDYKLYYTTDNGESVVKTLTRVVDVYDDVAPIITVDDNARLDEDKVSTNVLKYARATVGSRLLINNIKVYDEVGNITNLRNQITCLLIKPDGSKQDLTQTMKEENYYLSIEFDAVGLYSLIFEVNDSAENGAMLRYEVDVRNEWLNVFVLAGIHDTVYSSNDLFIPDFQIKGVAGNVLTDKAGESGLYECTDANNIKLVKENVAGTKIKDLASGNYYIKYSVSEGANVHEKLLYFTVIDTTKPMVSVSGGSATGRVGQEIKLATFIATDNDIIRKETITIKFGDKDVAMYDNAFIPEEKGEYVVTHTVVDVAGNQTITYYTVTVSEASNGCASNMDIISIMPIFAMLSAVMTIKKRKQKNEN